MAPGVPGRSCTLGLSPLAPRRFHEVQANNLYPRERMPRSSRSLSYRKQNICMTFVTRGHRQSQAGDTTATGDAGDLPRVRSGSGLTSCLHRALRGEDNLIPGALLRVNPLRGGDERWFNWTR